MIPDFAKPKFEVGKTLMSPTVAKLSESVLMVELYIDRHRLGDWDDSGEDDRALNLSAIANNDKVFSRFNTSFGLIKITTTSSRNTTIVTLEEETFPT